MVCMRWLCQVWGMPELLHLAVPAEVEPRAGWCILKVWLSRSGEQSCSHTWCVSRLLTTGCLVGLGA